MKLVFSKLAAGWAVHGERRDLFGVPAQPMIKTLSAKEERAHA